MSYWESYWVKGDIIEDHYESERGDQGIHLLIGDPDYLGKDQLCRFYGQW